MSDNIHLLLLPGMILWRSFIQAYFRPSAFTSVSIGDDPLMQVNHTDKMSNRATEDFFRKERRMDFIVIQLSSILLRRSLLMTSSIRFLFTTCFDALISSKLTSATAATTAFRISLITLMFVGSFLVFGVFPSDSGQWASLFLGAFTPADFGSSPPLLMMRNVPLIKSWSTRGY